MNKTLNVGADLANLRREFGVAQATVARGMGLAPSNICRFETGTVQVSLEWVQRYVDALNAAANTTVTVELAGKKKGYWIKP